MICGDPHRLLDMQEAADDLSAIVERGRPAWADGKFVMVTQLLSLREALGEIDTDDLEGG